MRTFLKYNIWAISWGLFIVGLTILPGKVFPKLPTFMDLLQPDKLVHVFVFSVFFFLQARGFVLQDLFPGLRKHAILFAFFIGGFLGAVTEINQEYFVPMRVGNLYDFIANIAGCTIGYGGFCLWRKRNFLEYT